MDAFAEQRQHRGGEGDADQAEIGRRGEGICDSGASSGVHCGGDTVFVAEARRQAGRGGRVWRARLGGQGWQSWQGTSQGRESGAGQTVCPSTCVCSLRGSNRKKSWEEIIAQYKNHGGKPWRSRSIKIMGGETAVLVQYQNYGEGNNGTYIKIMGGKPWRSHYIKITEESHGTRTASKQ